MIVVSLTSVPPSLRGDLTRWMFEIDTGVFVGRMSARVRDELWDRIVRECGTGRAIMVYGTNSEQRFDFRVHNFEWVPEDFDGIKIMRRPLPQGQVYFESVTGFSKIDKYQQQKNRYIVTNKSELAFVTLSSLKQDNIDEVWCVLWNEVSDEISSAHYSFLNNAESDYAQMLSDLAGHTIVLEDSSATRALKSLMASKGSAVEEFEFVSLRALAKKRLPLLPAHNVNALADHFGFTYDDGLLNHSQLLYLIYVQLDSTNSSFSK